jgi:hypothetical protein
VRGDRDGSPRKGKWVYSASPVRSGWMKPSRAAGGWVSVFAEPREASADRLVRLADAWGWGGGQGLVIAGLAIPPRLSRADERAACPQAAGAAAAGARWLAERATSVTLLLLHSLAVWRAPCSRRLGACLCPSGSVPCLVAGTLPRRPSVFATQHARLRRKKTQGDEGHKPHRAGAAPQGA